MSRAAQMILAALALTDVAMSRGEGSLGFHARWWLRNKGLSTVLVSSACGLGSVRVKILLACVQPWSGTLGACETNRLRRMWLDGLH